MKKFRIILILFCFFIFSFGAKAQSDCLKIDTIAKWEVLDSTKTVIYDSQGIPIAFVIFGLSSNLKKSGENFRFFSSKICKNDRVQTTEGMTIVMSIEPIRR